MLINERDIFIKSHSTRLDMIMQNQIQMFFSLDFQLFESDHSNSKKPKFSYAYYFLFIKNKHTTKLLLFLDTAHNDNFFSIETQETDDTKEKSQGFRHFCTKTEHTGDFLTSKTKVCFQTKSLFHQNWFFGFQHKSLGGGNSN